MKSLKEYKQTVIKPFWKTAEISIDYSKCNHGDFVYHYLIDNYATLYTTWNNEVYANTINRIYHKPIKHFAVVIQFLSLYFNKLVEHEHVWKVLGIYYRYFDTKLAADFFEKHWQAIINDKHFSPEKIFNSPFVENPYIDFFVKYKWSFIKTYFENKKIYNFLHCELDYKGLFCKSQWGIELIVKHWNWFIDKHLIAWDGVLKNPHVIPLLNKHWTYIYDNYIKLNSYMMQSLCMNTSPQMGDFILKHWDIFFVYCNKTKHKMICVDDILFENPVMIPIMIERYKWFMANTGIPWWRIYNNPRGTELAELYWPQFLKHMKRRWAKEIADFNDISGYYEPHRDALDKWLILMDQKLDVETILFCFEKSISNSFLNYSSSIVWQFFEKRLDIFNLRSAPWSAEPRQMSIDIKPSHSISNWFGHLLNVCILNPSKISGFEGFVEVHWDWLIQWFPDTVQELCHLSPDLCLKHWDWYMANGAVDTKWMALSNNPVYYDKLIPLWDAFFAGSDTNEIKLRCANNYLLIRDGTGQLIDRYNITIWHLRPDGRDDLIEIAPENMVYDEYEFAARDYFCEHISRELAEVRFHPKNIAQFPGWGFGVDD